MAGLDEEQPDLLTVIGSQLMESGWERLVQPQIFMMMLFRFPDLDRTARSSSWRDAIANGQYMLFRREAYEAVGGHAAVRSQIAEDLVLAQRVKRAGLRLAIRSARDGLATRMYRSLGEIVEGWSKNMALGAPLTLPPIRLVRGLAPDVMWTPVLVWVLPPIVWALTGWTPAAIATVLSLAIWLVTYTYERVNPAYALLYPVGAVAVALIMIKSAWRGARRVEWKGRVYGR